MYASTIIKPSTSYKSWQSDCSFLKSTTFFSRLWFHFTVENTCRDQRVIFNVVNLSKWKTLFTEGLTPVVKSTSRPRWQRMQQQFVFYYQSPIHNDHFILSFAFSFDREDERYSFGLAQPYSLSRYNLYMGTINMSSWAVERWDPLTAHIDVCSKQSLIRAVGKIPKNCGFVLPLILMIAFSKH